MHMSQSGFRDPRDGLRGAHDTLPHDWPLFGEDSRVATLATEPSFGEWAGVWLEQLAMCPFVARAKVEGDLPSGQE